MDILGNKFDGPFTDTASLKNAPGIIAVAAKKPSGPSWAILDVAAVIDVKKDVVTSPNKARWNDLADGRQLGVLVKYTVGGEDLADDIIASRKPPCN